MSMGDRLKRAMRGKRGVVQAAGGVLTGRRTRILQAPRRRGEKDRDGCRFRMVESDERQG
jgi:hypothetical protein